MAAKLCIDCKHYRKITDGEECVTHSRCYRPQSISLIDGTIIPRDCYDERRYWAGLEGYNKFCGKEGVYWEASGDYNVVSK